MIDLPLNNSVPSEEEIVMISRPSAATGWVLQPIHGGSKGWSSIHQRVICWTELMPFTPTGGSKTTHDFLP
jgi:hypothetical protein